MTTNAHFTNKETGSPRKVQKLDESAQVRSVAGFETRPACEPQHLLLFLTGGGETRSHRSRGEEGS